MNAEQKYYEALSDWEKAIDQRIVNDIKIRQKAAIKAQKIIDMLEAGVEIDEPDGGQYD